jgi:hypothetical protein
MLYLILHECCVRMPAYFHLGGEFLHEIYADFSYYLDAPNKGPYNSYKLAFEKSFC